MNSSLQTAGPVVLMTAALALLSGAGSMRLAADTPAGAVPQPHYASPEKVVKALEVAAKARDRAAVDVLFGPAVKELLSGDPRQDALEFEVFAKSVGQYSHLTQKADDRYILNIGAQNWPLPIPIVRSEGTWYFDTLAGKDEIINRRVGEDETTAIGVCRTYVQAQREYGAEDRDGSGVLKFAQQLKSAPNAKDGLYWPASAGEEQSPFGPLVAEAHAEGYGGKTAGGQPRPFKGYLFKILTSQGASAPGGAFNYVINGNLIAGFALVAYPAHWGESGVMTFMVNQWGKVYQANLGDQSAEIASEMTEFDPDSSWTLLP